jgi:uncharacterized membrane protein YbhN (UPF0104 family)
MAPENAKKPWRRYLIWAVALLTFGFFAKAVYTQWDVISAWRPDAGDFALLAAASLLTGMSCFINAENWLRLVRGMSAGAITRRAAYRSFTTTQLGKYLPGNALHFVGRHFWLKREGVRHRDLVAATLAEAAMQVLGAACVAALALLWATDPNAGGAFLGLLAQLAPLPLLAAALLAGTCGTALLMDETSRLGKRRALLKGLLSALVGAALFFAIQGGIFLGLTRLFTPETDALVIAVAALSWIVGFVVPGAPGGLGMREASFLVLLGPVMSPGDAVLAIALARLVSILGDLLCFAFGQIIAGKSVFDLNPD